MSKNYESAKNDKEGRTTMHPKRKLIAGPARVSARSLTVAEIQNIGLEDLMPPFTYGLVTSAGWDFKHTIEGDIIIFNMNTAVKLFSDIYILEEKMIIAKFSKPRGISDSYESKAFAGFGQEYCTERKIEQ